MQMAKGPMCVSHTGIGAIQSRGANFQKGDLVHFPVIFSFSFVLFKAKQNGTLGVFCTKKWKNVNLVIRIHVTYFALMQDIAQNVAWNL